MRRRVLFVTPYVPSPLRVRPYNLIKGLTEAGHRVTALAVCTSTREREDAVALARVCEWVHTVEVRPLRSLWSCVGALRTDMPLQALYCYSHAMQSLIDGELGATDSYDLVHVEHLRAAVFGRQIATVPRVYDSVDCISRLLEQSLNTDRRSRGRLLAWLDLERTRRFEAEVATRFEQVLISSEAEKRALSELARTPPGDRIRVLPNGVDSEYFRPTGQPRDPATLVYVGRMSYHANVVAVRHLLEDVMPLVWARRSDARVLIVGSDPPRTLRSLVRRYGPRVTVTGYVADVRPYLAQATVAVSPLRYAVGVQNKVLEAMAMATPVVTSPAGCAALAVRDGEQLFAPSTAVECADRVIQLLNDQGLQRRIGENGRRFVETHHQWKAVVARLEEIYDGVITRFQHARARRLK